MDLFTGHSTQGQQWSADEMMSYQRKAEQMLTDENCFHLLLVSCSVER